MLGVIASLALLIYALYFYALVKAVPVTLTLPGIAGLILTLGVAADANIVIFERVKEEIRAGRGVSTAITNGYRKGLTAIIDANVVTLLVAFILFILATAGVKGFAFMLGLGVIVSLFTAVLATQAILFSLRGTRLIRGRFGLGASEQRFNLRKNYMGASKWFFSASGLIMLIGAFAIAGNGLNFGIDFEGGTRITAPLAEGRQRRRRCATRCRAPAWPTPRSRRSTTRTWAATSSRSPRARARTASRRRRRRSSRSSASPTSRRRSRSARPSARAWRARR